MPQLLDKALCQLPLWGMSWQVETTIEVFFAWQVTVRKQGWQQCCVNRGDKNIEVGCRLNPALQELVDGFQARGFVTM